MPEEVGYSQRVRVQATQALPGVSADSFGAGVGQAVAQAGAVVQQEALENARLDRELRDNAEWSAFLLEDAKAREELSTIAREGRLSDQPGHGARIAAELQKREESLLGSLSSDRLKQQGRARIAEWGGTLRTREADYEFLRGQEIAVERFEEQRGIIEGRIRRADDPKVYAHELKFQIDAIETLNTSDEIKKKLLDDTEQRFAVAFIRGMTDRDPQAAMALIDSGAFDGIITGDQVEVLRNGTIVEIDRVQAREEREQREVIANIKGQIGVFLDLEKAGAVAEPEEYDKWIGLARATGDDGLVTQIALLKQNSEFTRVYGPENMDAYQREQKLATLAAKGKLSPEEGMLLKFLRDKSPGWASQEASDPVTQASRRGGAGAPPVIDLNDGATWNARAQWMAGRSLKVGFRDDELRELQGVLDTPSGELALLGQLDKVTDITARRRMAEQIAPNDPTFRQMAIMRPQVRAQLRQGRKAMVNNPKFFSDLDQGVEDAFADADARINRALESYDDDLRDEVRETYRQLLAGGATARGQGDYSGRKRDNSFEWDLYVATAVALGGRVIVQPNGQKVVLGGIQDWYGHPYELPSDVNEEGFKARLARELRQTRNPPINPDGSLANLYRAVPVSVGDGWYEWETPKGLPIKAKTGERFRVRLDR